MIPGRKTDLNQLGFLLHDALHDGNIKEKN